MTPELLSTQDLIIELFIKVDDRLNELNLNQKHSQADLHPSEVVTLALLFALKGVGNRAFAGSCEIIRPSSQSYHTARACFVCSTLIATCARPSWPSPRCSG